MEDRFGRSMFVTIEREFFDRPCIFSELAAWLTTRFARGRFIDTAIDVWIKREERMGSLRGTNEGEDRMESVVDRSDNGASLAKTSRNCEPIVVVVEPRDVALRSIRTILVPPTIPRGSFFSRVERVVVSRRYVIYKINLSRGSLRGTR